MKQHSTKRLEDKKTTINNFLAVFITLVLFFNAPTFLLAQSEKPQIKNARAAQHELDGGFFKIRIPLGFEQDPVDEPGIYKWKKDSGQIYIVSGESFFQPADAIFQSLRKAAQDDARIEETKIVKLKGGKALLCKERGSAKPNEMLKWRLIVFTDKKMLNIDFTAPTKDFMSFVPAFEEALRSLKLVSQS